MELCREKQIGIAFVGEAWIEKNCRGIQTHSSFVLMSMVQRGRRVMGYVRKGREEEVEVVKEEDNLIILQEQNKKRKESVYANRKWHGEKWKGWQGKLEEEMGGEGSILGDWNMHLH